MHRQRPPDPIPAVEKQARFVAVATLTAVAIFGLWSLTNLVEGNKTIALQNAAMTLAFFGAYFVNRRGRHLAAATLAMTLMLAHMAFAIYLFGYKSDAHVFLVAGAVASYLLFGQTDARRAHFFAALCTAGYLASVGWRDQLPTRHVIVSIEFMSMLNATLAISSLLAMAVAFVRIVARSEAALEAAHRQVNDLLLTLLPEVVAERLKAAPNVTIADRHTDVSVMFVDIVGFTELADRSTPAETVAMLDRLFTEFDRACDRFGVEKIRTMGDGYMVVAGAPEPRADHPIAIIETGFAFREAAQAQGARIRIGANCGEVVAGVVGLQRFQYDVWGDTVNVAARMETTGEADRLHVTEALKRHIEEYCVCLPRGSVTVKGKGEMMTWFIEPKEPRNRPSPKGGT